MLHWLYFLQSTNKIFSGATTGTGGRIRDIQAIGKGGYYIAGTAGYSVGNLLIPGFLFT